jgi:hypothetical protein
MGCNLMRVCRGAKQGMYKGQTVIAALLMCPVKVKLLVLRRGFGIKREHISSNHYCNYRELTRSRRHTFFQSRRVLPNQNNIENIVKCDSTARPEGICQAHRGICTQIRIYGTIMTLSYYAVTSILDDRFSVIEYAMYSESECQVKFSLRVQY